MKLRPSNYIVIDDTDYQCNYMYLYNLNKFSVAILAPSDNIKTETDNNKY